MSLIKYGIPVNMDLRNCIYLVTAQNSMTDDKMLFRNSVVMII